MRITLLSGLCLLAISFTAQTRNHYDASEILHKLQQLEIAGSVLYIAAHPDDENTRLLSYLSNEKKMRTAYLSLTRGEGGQNLIGKEQGPALGILRTQELMAARSIDGAEQYFSRAADFGYSKTAEETFAKWNRDSVLSDMVLVIRRLKPDVIICRFPPDSKGGHGHHTASAVLALEAFDAAADKNRFPEQLAHYSTWQSRRIFWNTYNFSSANTIGPGQFTVDVGGYNPVLGKSYGEIASESRSMHKSQGFGTMRQRGVSLENFKLLKGDSAGTDLFADIDQRLAKIPAFAKVARSIAACVKNYEAAAPHESVDDLCSVYKMFSGIETDDPEAQYWKSKKMKECAELIADCAGLWFEAVSKEPYAVPGHELALTVSALNRSSTEIVLHKISFHNTEHKVGRELASNKTFTLQINRKIGGETKLSNPFWLDNEDSEISAFNTSSWAGRRATPPSLSITLSVSVNDLPLTITEALFHKRGDPVKGEINEPLYVVPPVEVSLAEKVYVLKKGESKNVRVKIKAMVDSVQGYFALRSETGIKIQLVDSVFSILKKGEEQWANATISADGLTSGKITALAYVSGTECPYELRWIAYDHIPLQIFAKKASAVIVMPELEKGVSKVGYIAGAGDEVAECLEAAGYQVSMLNIDEMNVRQLQEYDAVVTGIRAFNVNDKLHLKMPMLLHYVKAGGNLIIQYNTNSRVGPLEFVPGPYPFSITRLRTTDENARVIMNDPAHMALTQPNKITDNDFVDWVQERGIYFADKTDPRYTSLFRMKDPGEEELAGSTIVTKYGKGNFVYTGLAFFRQLPAGVPGAYRLFANLLSLPTEK